MRARFSDALYGFIEWIEGNPCTTLCVALILYYGTPFFLANWAILPPFDVVIHTLGHNGMLAGGFMLVACIAADGVTP